MTRLIMVLSSMAPLFLLWAVGGSQTLQDLYFIPACLFLAIAPTFILCRRVIVAKRNNDCQTKTIGKAEDHRDHILVYLFAMLLPLYTTNLTESREFFATLLALVFIIFLFWNLNLHYMNLLFAILGYRVFTVNRSTTNNFEDKSTFVLLSKRGFLTDGEKIEAYRLSDSVFIEK